MRWVNEEVARLGVPGEDGAVSLSVLGGYGIHQDAQNGEEGDIGGMDCEERNEVMV